MQLGPTPPPGQTLSPLAEVVSATDWQRARFAVVGVGYPGGTLPVDPVVPAVPDVPAVPLAPPVAAVPAAPPVPERPAPDPAVPVVPALPPAPPLPLLPARAAGARLAAASGCPAGSGRRFSGPAT